MGQEDKKGRNTVMISGRLSVCIIMCASVYLCAAESNHSSDSHPILRVLRANDAKFDNLEIKYLQIENCEIRPDRFRFWKFGDDPSKMPDDYWTPRTVKWATSCSLVVRGSDAVLSSQFEPSLSEKDRYVTHGAYHKDGNLGGVRYTLSDMQLPDDDPSKNTPNYEKQLWINKMRSAMGGLYDTRMAIEFAHGIGFGKRIKNIDSVDAHNNGFRITGDIQIWAQDVSRFEIEFDNDYLVRKAVIRADVKGNQTRFEVLTKGAVRNAELLLAKSGSFRRIWEPSREQQAKDIKPKTMQDFQVEFKSLAVDLSNERYAQLTEFKIEPLMQVDDHFNDIHGTGARREDGSVFVKQRPRLCGESEAANEQAIHEESNVE